MAKYEEDSGGNSGKFLRINGQLGCIVAKSDEPMEGYTEYTTTNPSTGKEVTYYVKQYKGGVEGKVLGLERVAIEEKKVFGYNLHMEDDEGRFSIFFNDDRPTTQRLLKTYENFDLDEEVHVKVFKDDQGYAGISFKQNGKKVEQYWTKEKLPEPKKVKGRWSYANVDDFLYNNAMENIVPNYTPPAKAEAAAAGAEAEATAASEADDDDVPF